MSKRRATDELYGDSTKRPDHPGRREEFTANLRALNSNFAQWVQQQAAQAEDQLWLAAVKDYASHAEKLLNEFSDVLLNGKQYHSSTQLANNLFGTPAPAATNGTDSILTGSLSTGAPGGGSKSVTFAAGPTTFVTPGGAGTAAGSATAATPGTSNTTNAGHTPAPATGNTANAGHTPAPASGLSSQFAATPAAPHGSGNDLPSPQPFKLGAAGGTPSSAGENAATPAQPSGFTFGNGGGASVAGSPASTVGFGTPIPTPAAGAKGFTFGASSSNTPAGDGAAAASSSGVTYSFGATPATGGSNGTGATAATAGGTAGFSFGATPAAGGGGSAPAFGFASTGAGSNSTAGGFSFPAPAAAGTADTAAGNEAEESDEPPKHKLELKVDEDKWKVLFSSKSKLHLLKGSQWDDRGVGMLTMRQPKNSEGKTYITFGTEGGKQLVASPLMNKTKVTPVDKTPKRCRMLLLVPQYQLPPSASKTDTATAATPTSNTEYQLQGCMFTFNTEEKVKQFAQLVEEHKPVAEDK